MADPDRGVKKNEIRDPRKDPQVLAALKRAGRGDPAADPFKPVGRAAFLIWMVVIAGSAGAIALTGDTIDYRGLGMRTAAFAGALATGGPEQAEALKLVDGHPLGYLVDVLKWTVAISGAAALYYLAIYLVGQTAVRGVSRASARFYTGVIRPVGHAIVRSGHRTIEQVRRARANRHGPDPDNGLFNR